ncbi:MAG: YtxH domain-containing protein [Bacteroidales bacterium]|jgi:gas vesicle protein|nr:YtxH domain-containing protein [Bacteroidales bacterium]
MKQSHIYAFLSGALIGGVVALLFAPDKGTETRRKIGNKVKAGTNYTKEQIEHLLDYLRRKAADGIVDLEEDIIELEEQLADIEEKLREKNKK